MSIMSWIVIIICGGFTLAVIASLIFFVINIFRHAQPQKRKR